MAHDEDTSRTSMKFLSALPAVMAAAVSLINSKSRTYGPSWKRRGGAGAWFTLVRPWDRLETIVERHGGDVFAAVAAEPLGGDGTALDAIRDCRNYLSLIEAEMVARGVVEMRPIEQYKIETMHDEAVPCTEPEAVRLGRMGAGPIADGCYTILDLGASRELWMIGVRALPSNRQMSVPTETLRSLESVSEALRRCGALVASRELIPVEGQERGDIQIIIRIQR